MLYLMVVSDFPNFDFKVWRCSLSLNLPICLRDFLGEKIPGIWELGSEKIPPQSHLWLRQLFLFQLLVVKRMDAALQKCSLFMEEAMSCLPPKAKIEKYKSRLEKVFSNTRYYIKKRRCHRPGKKKDSSEFAKTSTR